MGWTFIGNTIVNRRGGGQSWSTYWSKQSEVLFFGLYSEISGGQMPNRVPGATDYLTVAGSAGSETYQCPNTAAYIAADTDYIWFKTDATQRTTTTAELIGYDLQRTPVKYNDTTPNAIVAIMILKAGETIAGTKRDKMFTDFWLPIMWDNSLSAYGHVKDNRGATQQLWTPESVYCAEYLTVYNALTTKPSSSIAAAQNTFLKALVDNGVFAKLDRLFVFAQTTNAAGEALKDWIDPTRTASLGTAAPDFTPLEGFTGDGSTKYITSGFTPSAGGNKYVLNSASAGCYQRLDISHAGVIMGSAATAKNLEFYPRYTDNKMYFAINVATTAADAIANTDARGMFIASRGASTTINVYKNKTKTAITHNSTTVSTRDVHILCCINQSGTRDSYSAYQVSLVFFGQALTDPDVTIITDAFEVYMDSNSKGVI